MYQQFIVGEVKEERDVLWGAIINTKRRPEAEGRENIKNNSLQASL